MEVADVDTVSDAGHDLPELAPPLVPVDEPTAWKRLAATIIEQAVWDYRSVIEQGGLARIKAEQAARGPVKPSGRAANAADAESAVRFFETQAFENMCLFVKVDAGSIRERLAREGSVA